MIKKNASGHDFNRLWALSSLKHQAGFLIPLALFIVVSAATLGVAMGQLAAGSRSSAILLALNAQALFTADAGVQSVMHNLYYGADTRAAVDANCEAVDGDMLSLTGQGVAGCRLVLNCTVAVSAFGNVSLYTLESQSQCGSGDYVTSRRVRAWSYMKNN